MVKIRAYTHKEISPGWRLSWFSLRKVSEEKTVDYCFFRCARAKQGVSEAVTTASETTMLASRRRTAGESPVVPANKRAEGKRGKNSWLLFFPTRPMKIRRKSSLACQTIIFDYIFEPSENRRWESIPPLPIKKSRQNARADFHYGRARFAPRTSHCGSVTFGGKRLSIVFLHPQAALLRGLVARGRKRPPEVCSAPLVLRVRPPTHKKRRDDLSHLVFFGRGGR